LKQDRLEELISSLYEVSDPAHEKCVDHSGMNFVVHSISS
jgi:hypothetical protein